MTELQQQQKKWLTTGSNMSSVYISNKNLCMFQQVILRSVGDMLRTRASVFGSLFFLNPLTELGETHIYSRFKITDANLLTQNKFPYT